jgi:sugar lactone lactonase YvrE
MSSGSAARLSDMTTWNTLIDGLSFGESPRWHDDRLWLCDWGASELIAVGLDGARETIATVPSFPFCIDWDPDGRLLITHSSQQSVVTIAADGSLEPVADLSAVSNRPPGNEIVVDPSGHAYVNGGGFDMMAGEAPAPGMIALLTADGGAREVAGDLGFPNGMAVTPDGRTLICAESYAGQLTAFDIAADGSLENRRVWAAIEGSAPDGIALDAEGAVWFADVPNRRCVRVAQGGEVLDTRPADRGCFSCALGGPDGRTLFAVVRRWDGPQGLQEGDGTGQVLMAEVEVPAA